MVQKFQGLSESYLQERADDVKEIGHRVLRNLLGVKERDRWFSGSVVLVAPVVAMSDILLVAPQRLRGIVTGKGSTTSHLSILAKSLGVPLVAGAPGVEQAVREGDQVIVDGNAGTVYINPSSEVRREYERLKQEFRAFSRELDGLRDLPAITHLDYSARLQTVSRERKPDYHAVIAEFERLTGCAVIVNTSFNVRGEPIICTPEDAYRCFMRTEMDVLVIEDCMMFKEEQPLWKERKGWRDELELD